MCNSVSVAISVPVWRGQDPACRWRDSFCCCLKTFMSVSVLFDSCTSSSLKDTRPSMQMMQFFLLHWKFCSLCVFLWVCYTCCSWRGQDSACRVLFLKTLLWVLIVFNCSMCFRKNCILDLVLFSSCILWLLTAPVQSEGHKVQHADDESLFVASKTLSLCNREYCYTCSSLKGTRSSMQVMQVFLLPFTFGFSSVILWVMLLLYLF